MTNTAYLHERNKLVDAISQGILTYAAAVRQKEKEKHASAVNLLATIAANVDNGSLSDAQFREFVRSNTA